MFDVVIVGGGMMGSATAWWLTETDPALRVCVVERDPTYAFAATSHTNSCIRQQFSAPVNIEISRFGADFLKTLSARMGDPEVPDLPIQSYGYMYLAGDADRAAQLRAAQAVQAAAGSATRILTPEELRAEYPFYRVDDVILGSHNPVDEGYFDGGTLFDMFRRQAKRRGVTFRPGEVAEIVVENGSATGVRVDGEVIAAGAVVVAAGTRARGLLAPLGIDIPVEPRRRYTYIFDAAERLDRDLPLTIDPSGVHMRTDGEYYLAGCPPDADPPVDVDDFDADHDLWEEKVWPVLAHRVPAFERIKLIRMWVGHYDYNTLDQNALIGPIGPERLYLLNGFSGHGLQQSPAMGRGMAELIVHGGYRTLDLTPLSVERLATGTPFRETAVI